uniref:Peptidase S74 domain-containing protein n=1 Tax=viral metagenome TaxID=1070528 RepID=A0A6C0F6V5_9ZZZZ
MAASSFSAGTAESTAFSGEGFGTQEINRDIVIFGTFGLGPSIEGGLANIINYTDLGRIDIDTAGKVIYDKVLTAGGSFNNPTVNDLYGLIMLNDTTNATESSYITFNKSRNSSLLSSGDSIGNISFRPWISRTDGIDNFAESSSIRSLSRSNIISSKVNSELIFSTTGQSNNSTTIQENDRLLIDIYGNVNTLNKKELRITSSSISSYVGFKASPTTSSPGYSLTMPSTEGSPGDYLSINSTGFGAVISFTVVDQKITAATVETSGSGYDTNSYPDIVTTGQSHTNPAQVVVTGLNASGGISSLQVIDGGDGYTSTFTVNVSSQNKLSWVNGGNKLTIIGTMPSGGTFSTKVGFLSSTESSVDDYYNGWLIETNNPTGKFIITDYVGSTKQITVSPNATSNFSTSTTYTLKWMAETGVFTGNNILSSLSRSINAFYNGWYIIAVENSNSTGNKDYFEGIISGYVGSSKTISITWSTGSHSSDSIGSSSGMRYSLINNNNPVGSTNVIAGHGLTGGGTTDSSSITLNLDIGAITDSSYNVNSSTDHMLVYDTTGSGTTKRSTVSSFLSNIVGDGMAVTNNKLAINDVQSFTQLTGNKMTFYNENFLHFRMGVNDNINLDIEPIYSGEGSFPLYELVDNDGTSNQFTFTNCGRTGRDGPDLSHCTTGNNAYTSTWITNDTSRIYFNVIGLTNVKGIQVWTVPRTGVYDIDAYGAKGGSSGLYAHTGGNGARVKGRFTLNQGDKYMIVVGQKGLNSNSSGGPGGGGGTYMVKGDSFSLIESGDVVLVAGGGGASGGHSISNDGQNASSASGSSTSGGAAGNSYKSGGGGGLIGNGIGPGYYMNRDTFGLSFKNGSRGGDRGGWSNNTTKIYDAEGGFGGGGGGSAHSGGGGGGYGGGQGGFSLGSNPDGHGGTSKRGGTNQINQDGVNSDHGKLIINYISSTVETNLGSVNIKTQTTTINNNSSPGDDGQMIFSVGSNSIGGTEQDNKIMRIHDTGVYSISGYISSTTITSGGVGSGYTTGNPPTISFSQSPLGVYYTATGTCIVNNSSGQVTGVIITKPGEGYITTPTVSIVSQGSGSGLSSNSFIVNVSNKPFFGEIGTSSIKYDAAFKDINSESLNSTTSITSTNYKLNNTSSDGIIEFQQSGTTKYIVGIDNSDNHFKINYGSSLPSSSNFTLDTSGNLAISGTVTANSFSGSLPISQLSGGNVPVNIGGTNNNSYTGNGLLYYDNSTTKIVNGAGITFNSDSITTLYSFASHTFTNCGATGRFGPTLDDCVGSGSNAYTASWTDNTSYFNIVVQGIQLWTVPASGNYEIDAYGAKGGDDDGSPAGAVGGKGARVKGTFNLVEGDKYMILVGQMGLSPTHTSAGGSGGGGTFIVKGTSNSDDGNDSANVLMVAAGGGGAERYYTSGVETYGEDTNNTNTTSTNTGGGYQGTYGSGGGGGLKVNGSGNGYSNSYPNNVGGRAFVNGGTGGHRGGYSNPDIDQHGGFGGGGGSSTHVGGGGGGMKGGNGGILIPQLQSGPPSGRAGLSHFKSTWNGISTNTTITGGYNSTHGKVIITYLASTNPETNLTVKSTFSEGYPTLSLIEKDGTWLDSSGVGDAWQLKGKDGKLSISSDHGGTSEKMVLELTGATSETQRELKVYGDLEVSQNITGGGWQGGLIGVAYGGTGVNNITSFKNILDDETWTFANLTNFTSGITVNGTTTLNNTVSITSNSGIEFNNSNNKITGLSNGLKIQSGSNFNGNSSDNYILLDTPKLLLSAATNGGDIELRFRSDNYADDRGDNWAFKMVDTGTGGGSTFNLKSDYGKSSTGGSVYYSDLSDTVLSITGTAGSSTGYTSTFTGSLVATTFSGNINGSIGSVTPNSAVFSSLTLNNNRIVLSTTYTSMAIGVNIPSIPLLSNTDTDKENNLFIGHSSGQYYTSGKRNTVLGYYSGRHINGGNYNVYVGGRAGTRNKSGDNNVAVGYNSGSNGSSDTGLSNSYSHSTFVGNYSGHNATATYLSLIGNYSGYAITTGSYSTFTGANSGMWTNTGLYNSFTGYQAGYYNRSGGYNTYMGAQTGRGTSTSYSGGSHNTLIGRGSGYNIRTGNYNSFLGNWVGRNLTTGNYNISIGAHSGYYLVSGSRNINVGYQAGFYNTGSDNIIIGYQAGNVSTTSDSKKLFIDITRRDDPLIHGDFSDTNRKIIINGDLDITGTTTINNLSGTFIGSIEINSTSTGSNTLQLGKIEDITIVGATNNNFYLGYNRRSSGGSESYNTTVGTSISPNMLGSSNTFMGYNSGYNTSGGNHNTSIGSRSGYSNISGSYNTNIGGYSGYSTSGSYNTRLGYQSGYASGSYSYSTMLGTYAGRNNTGSWNNYIGYQSGYFNTSGWGNNNIGYKAGYYNKTGGYNINIGHEAGRGVSNNNNTHTIHIGFRAGLNSIADYSTIVGSESGLYCNASSTNNIFLGYQSGYYNSSGGFNIYIGNAAGFSNTTGLYNVSIGNASSNTATTASFNTFVGLSSGRMNSASKVTGIGTDSLYKNTSEGSTSLGFKSGFNNTSGTGNTNVGFQAGFSNSTGTRITMMGYNSGYYNTGSDNTFIGYESGKANTSGAYNVYLGSQSGDNTSNSIYQICIGANSGGTGGNYNVMIGGYSGNVTNGHENTFIGTSSGYSNTSGSSNVIVGRSAGWSQTTATNNTMVGKEAGKNNTASNNTFFGYKSGYSNNSGTGNTNIGYQAGYSQTSNTNNTMVGYSSGYNNSGTSNTFIGYDSGKSNTGGDYNVYVGTKSGDNTDSNHQVCIGYNSGGTDGDYNVMVGGESGNSNTGDDNIFIGVSAGYKNTSGDSNVIIGRAASWQQTTANYNVVIGRDAGFESTDSGVTFIGYKAGYNNEGTGTMNTMVGYKAGTEFTRSPGDGGGSPAGGSNTFMGYEVALKCTTGGFNTYIGTQSGGCVNTSTGGWNAIVGEKAGYNNTSGSSQAFFGRGSGYSNTTGYRNTLLGNRAGYENKFGDYNVLIGGVSGYNLGKNQSSSSTCSKNVYIGDEAGYDRESSLDNCFIGYSSGKQVTSGNQNTFMGSYSGFFETGNRNICIGMMAGRLSTDSHSAGHNLYIDCYRLGLTSFIYGTLTSIPSSTSDYQTAARKMTVNANFKVAPHWKTELNDVYISSGSKLDFNNGDVTLTHSTNKLTVSGGTIDLGNNKITNLSNPTDAQDAATKSYVDATAEGLHIQPACRVATVSALSGTYSNGTNGVGATLTNNSTQNSIGNVINEGIDLIVNDRVLVKDQTSLNQNGIYKVTTVGTSSSAWVLTRTDDFDENGEMSKGDFVFVTDGTLNGGNGWVLTQTTEDSLFNFTTHTFTNCSATGTQGPTLAQCTSAYTPSWTDNTSYFNVNTQGVQEWKVPASGTYSIEAWGAKGGFPNMTANSNTRVGRGYKIKGTFTLTKGDIIFIVVGQSGTQNTSGNSANGGGGGGGGSFVWKKDQELPIIVAGGGGGQGITNHNFKGKAADGNSGNDGTPPGIEDSTPEANQGTNGSDGKNEPGTASFRAKGWNSTGKNTGGSLANFEGEATSHTGQSGYGGGGRSQHHAGGGGGGFSGGGVQDYTGVHSPEDNDTLGGGGGGSYFNTSSPYNGTGRIDSSSLGYNGNTGDHNAAHGKVVITSILTNNVIVWNQFSGAGEIVAGSGISKSGNTLSINFNSLSEAVINPTNDSIVFIDADGNSSKKESVSDFASAISDNSPTNGSSNPVKSSGVFTSLATKSTISGSTHTSNALWFCDNGTNKTMTTNSNLTFSSSTLNVPLITTTGNIIVGGSGAITIPSGGTFSGTPAAGMLRYNTTTNEFEGYSSSWGSIGGNDIGVVANGGLSMSGDNLQIDFSAGSSINGQLSTTKGGTNNNSWTTNGVVYYDGTKLHSDSDLTFDGTNLKSINSIFLNNTTNILTGTTNGITLESGTASTSFIQFTCPKILLSATTNGGDIELRFRSDSYADDRGDNWAFKIVDTGTTAGSTFNLKSDYGKSGAGGTGYNSELTDTVLSIAGTTGSSLGYTSTFTGTVAATTFSGSGASLTSLNATNLSSGTVPSSRLPGYWYHASTWISFGFNSNNRFETGTGGTFFRISGGWRYKFSSTYFSPHNSNTADLGSTSYKKWRNLYLTDDIFLESGSIINFNSGDITLTHSNNTLTIGGHTDANFAGKGTGLTNIPGSAISSALTESVMPFFLDGVGNSYRDIGYHDSDSGSDGDARFRFHSNSTLSSIIDGTFVTKTAANVFSPYNDASGGSYADLGSTSLAWKNIYGSNTLNLISNNSSITLGTGTTTVSLTHNSTNHTLTIGGHANANFAGKGNGLTNIPASAISSGILDSSRYGWTRSSVSTDHTVIYKYPGGNPGSGSDLFSIGRSTHSRYEFENDWVRLYLNNNTSYRYQWTTTAFTPGTDNAVSLGWSSSRWNDLYLGPGAIIYFGGTSSVTLTHDSTNHKLTIGGHANACFAGKGTDLTNLNATEISSGTLNQARMASAQSSIQTIYNTSLKIGYSGNSGSTYYPGIEFTSAEVKIRTPSDNNVGEVNIGNSYIKPGTDASVSLGVSDRRWSNLFMASGSKIDFNNGDITLTHSNDTLTFGGSGTGASSPVFNMGGKKIENMADPTANTDAATKGWVTSQITSSGGGTMDNVVDDTNPQLGGDLDTNNKNIVTVSNRDINLIPHGTGEVEVGSSTNTSNLNVTGSITVGAPGAAGSTADGTIVMDGGDLKIRINGAWKYIQFYDTNPNGLYSFTTHTFTNCGSADEYGPNLTECKNSYGADIVPWNNTSFFNVIGHSTYKGIQLWTVPKTGTYKIEAWGAKGGDGYTTNVGGNGAKVYGNFSLVEGEKIMIMVGQMGLAPIGSNRGGSGGGGTFVVKQPSGGTYSSITNSNYSTYTLVVAGGGGGSARSETSGNHGHDASHTSSTATGGGSEGGGYGTGGGGGLVGNGAGDGYYSDTTTGGFSFKSGGRGGLQGGYSSGSGGSGGTDVRGGFGGGGGSSVHAGGGGGGMKGGNGASTHNDRAHGGTSYNGGISGTTGGSSGSSPSGNNGHGKVIITKV